jgi:putative transcriptional regulator
MNQKLAPGLILAVPQMLDPNFRQTVVLLIEHNEEGAVGVVLNRESDVKLKDLCFDHHIPFVGDTRKRVRVGGPVQPERGIILFGAPHSDPESNRILDNLSVSASTNTLGKLCNIENSHFQCFAGYAGWGAGQLEQELEEGAWILGDAAADLILDCPTDAMWDRALNRLGIDPAALVPGGSSES